MAGPTTLYQTGVHGSRPAASAGCVLYFCTTHSKVYKSDGSAWTDWVTIPTGASVATDTIWDAAGDLAVGSGADTAAKLTLGAAGGAVSRINGAVAWNSGTSFPSAATGDRYWRTDLAMEFYYNGTRWLCTCPHEWSIGTVGGTQALTASGTIQREALPSLQGGSDIWIIAESTRFFVIGGTALGASHKWVGVYTLSANGSSTTPWTVNIDSGASNAWRTETTSVAALMNNGTTYLATTLTWTKTGTPGDLLALPTITYRIVG